MYFKKNNHPNLPTISTASLPDIVFILLFFFMTVTTIKNQDLLVKNQLPLANESEELNKTDRIIEIFVGHSKEEAVKRNKSALIQIDDRIVNIEDLGVEAIIALSSIPEHLRNKAIVSIKADHRVNMGVIMDIKKQLKKVNLLKINYTTVEGNIFNKIEDEF